MSVIIKGILMQKNCDDGCPIRQNNLARCQLTGRSTSHSDAGKPLNEKERPSWCPLAKVPATLEADI